MAITRLSKLLIAVTILLPAQSNDTEYCHLCEDGVAGLLRPHYHINSWGKTCVSLALETALQHPPGTAECDYVVDDYREICCGEEEPSPIEQSPTSSPVYTGPMGDYPACPICYDETYPSNPGMVINMLGIGADSCKKYYDYGRRGLIQTHLCDPLQSFAYEPCGCGIFTEPPPPSAPSAPSAPSPSPSPSTSPALECLFKGVQTLIGLFGN